MLAIYCLSIYIFLTLYITFDLVSFYYGLQYIGMLFDVARVPYSSYIVFPSAPSFLYWSVLEQPLFPSKKLYPTL